MLEGGRYFFRLFSGSRDVIKSLLLEIVEIAEIVARSGTVSAVVLQIDPSVPQPVSQSRRRPLLGPSPG